MGEFKKPSVSYRMDVGFERIGDKQLIIRSKKLTSDLIMLISK